MEFSIAYTSECVCDSPQQWQSDVILENLTCDGRLLLLEAYCCMLNAVRIFIAGIAILLIANVSTVLTAFIICISC